MPSSNIVDITQNGHPAHDHARTPEEIQLEITRTKLAITEDLLAISERLSPEHLREGAREVMRDAREEAKEMLRGAKDSAIDSLIGAKDSAIDSLIGAKDRAVERVSEKVSLLGSQARRASDLTVDFVSANALAVSLVGFGVGFLLVALRRRAQPERYGSAHYTLVGDRLVSEQDEPRRRLPERVRSVASHASEAVDHAREQVRSATTRAVRTARDGARQAAVRTRGVAGDNRVAVIAVTIAAGLGFGLLWPTGSGAPERIRPRPRSRPH